MQETSSENLNASSEHEEIARLEKELEVKKRALAEKGESPFAGAQEKTSVIPEKNFEAVSPASAAPIVQQPSSQQVAPVSVPHEEIKKHTEDIKKMEREEQLDRLAKIAVEKGPQSALKIAQRLDNPWLLDQYHDTLTDELYQKLLEKGHIKH